MNLPEKIAALKNGDEFIFGEIFNEFHQKLYFFILAKTKSAYLAEEVTQLTFIKLWNNRHKLDENSTISGYLFQIAKTTCIDALRKESHAAIFSADKTGEQYAAAGSERIEAEELTQRIKREVEKMPPVRRMVFELSRYQAKTHREIAQFLSLSEKTVEAHISLALKHLRKVLFILLVIAQLF